MQARACHIVMQGAWRPSTPSQTIPGPTGRCQHKRCCELEVILWQKVYPNLPPELCQFLSQLQFPQGFAVSELPSTSALKSSHLELRTMTPYSLQLSESFVQQSLLPISLCRAQQWGILPIFILQHTETIKENTIPPISPCNCCFLHLSPLFF